MNRSARYGLLAILLSACGADDTGPGQAASGAAVKAPIMADLAAGQALYARHCGACHDPGDGHPGTMRLNARVGNDKAVLVQRHDLAPDYVKMTVRNGLEMMPAFRPTELGDADVDAIAAYLAQRDAPGS